VKYFQKYAKDMVNRFDLKPGDFVFEVAANDGTLLKAFQDLGMKVLGVDPATEIAKKAGKGKDAVTIIPQFFTEELADEIIAKYGTAKLIIANNVLAHLDNVADIIKGVRTIMGSDGIFVFENSYFKDMYVNNLPDLIYHEHMSHFLVYPLQVVFRDHNMFLFDVQSKEVHGGSIRGFVSNKYREITNVDDFIKSERELGLIAQGDKHIKMTTWSQRIDHLRGSLWRTINNYINDGKKIACYGAPAKFTTLSYMLDLNQENIAYVVDDNPLKQGTYSPGKHIPVLPSSELKDNKPDVIVITAWNFADSIMEKCRKSGFKGKFIIPLPELRIIE
jgi:SAM-dependent methyltransferase